jgi:hypothetical protein
MFQLENDMVVCKLIKQLQMYDLDIMLLFLNILKDHNSCISKVKHSRNL